MTAASPSSSSVAERLKAAIAEPFLSLEDLDPSDPPPIWIWYRYLVNAFPLLTCQTAYFQARHERPSTFPLRLIVESLLHDDGIRDGARGGDYSRADGLTLSVDRRRYDLARRDPQSFNCLPESVSSDRFVSVMWPEDEVGYTNGEPSGVISYYERLGEELCALIDAREGASPECRGAIQAEIDEFLESLAAKRRRGGKGEGLTKDILKPLFEEATALARHAWECVGSTPSGSTRAIVRDWGLTQEDAQQEASWRLALPVFSRLEILGLWASREERERARGLGKKPTARRFAIWLLAHRFKKAPEAVANLVGAGSDWDYFNEFNESQSPIPSE